jgi:hypothetical protein
MGGVSFWDGSMPDGKKKKARNHRRQGPIDRGEASGIQRQAQPACRHNPGDKYVNLKLALQISLDNIEIII